MKRSPLKRRKGLKRKPLRKVSGKQAKKLTEYYKVRREWMNQNPWCEICTAVGIKRVADDLHHKRGRGKYLCDRRYFSSLCRYHHTFTHDHPAWAREFGWLISKFK